MSIVIDNEPIIIIIINIDKWMKWMNDTFGNVNDILWDESESRFSEFSGFSEWMNEWMNDDFPSNLIPNQKKKQKQNLLNHETKKETISNWMKQGNPSIYRSIFFFLEINFEFFFSLRCY